MASMGLGSAAAVLLSTTGTDTGWALAAGYMIVFGVVMGLNMQSGVSSTGPFGPCPARYPPGRNYEYLYLLIIIYENNFDRCAVIRKTGSS